jgi:membrane-associated protease RseP (regulator of RpoE activity)
MRSRHLLFVVALVAPGFVRGDEPKKTKPTIVPYHLTDTQHVLVRIKLNGKGPFNFVVDTGCPVLVINTAVAKKAGLEDKKGLAIVDKLEFEGGLVQTKVKARVETPFQLEGMNGMGLAGLELHGLLGYTVLAKYKLEFDFTRDQLKWSPLDFDPPPPQALNIKGGTGGLEMMAGLMKVVSFMAGLKPAPPPVARGFLGFELEDKEDAVVVSSVLAKGPAAEAGLQSGDRIDEINGSSVSSVADAQKRVARVLPGNDVRVTVLRGDDKVELKLVAGHGL